jgi:hypothetical protein
MEKKPLLTKKESSNWRFNSVKTITTENQFKTSFATQELALEWHKEYLTKENPKQLVLKELPFIVKDKLKYRYQYFSIKTKIVEQPWSGSFETEAEALSWHKKYNDFWLQRGFELKLEKISSTASDKEEKVKVTEKTIYAESSDIVKSSKEMNIKLGAINEKNKIKLKASLNS